MKEETCGSEFALEASTFSDPVHRRIAELALPYLQTREGETHTRISYEFALRLLEAEGSDARVVIPTILLHDVGWSQVPEDQQTAAFGPFVKDVELTKVHEREGARIAKAILQSLGTPAEKIGKITSIISCHDTSLEARNLDEALIKDADKLFRFSEGGFPIECRWFESVPAHRLLSHFEEEIEDWFFSATGKRLAREETAARRREIGEGEQGQACRGQ